MSTGALQTSSSLEALLPALGKADSHIVGEDLVRDVLRSRFGFGGAFSALSAERDQNYRVSDTAGKSLVFKIFGAAQPPQEAELLAAVLAYLEQRAPGLPVPRLAANAAGQAITHFVDEAGRERAAIAYSFLDGVPAFSAERSPRQHRHCGTLLGELAIALEGFSHPYMHRPLIWDLRHLLELRLLMPQIQTLHFADFVESFLERYSRSVSPRLAQLPRRFVHNDMNGGNIIVDPDDPARITGIIDFGDAIHTYRIADVAVGVVGQLSTAESAPDAMHEFVTAYRKKNPLDEHEVALLPWLVAGRIVQNLILTSWYRQQNPDGAHFAAFGREFFEWRIVFAQGLALQADGDFLI
ncbi:phosphotransferase [Aurantiacibacter xanthus]|uniref:phosphotransferase n=1 Tax=Aurantiacibacter xanthus TaxID=1784712 RepID=UPI00174BF5F1|nr:phosphotransferase [Aurantiacibacter xanthus]